MAEVSTRTLNHISSSMQRFPHCTRTLKHISSCMQRFPKETAWKISQKNSTSKSLSHQLTTLPSAVSSFLMKNSAIQKLSIIIIIMQLKSTGTDFQSCYNDLQKTRNKECTTKLCHGQQGMQSVDRHGTQKVKTVQLYI